MSSVHCCSKPSEVRETQPLYNRQARGSDERLTWQFDDGDAAPQLVTLTAQILRSGNSFGTYRTARDAIAPSRVSRASISGVSSC